MDKVISLAFEAELKLTTKTSDIKKDLNNLNIIPPKILTHINVKEFKIKKNVIND